MARLLGAGSILLGVLCMLGWTLDVPVLRSILPGAVSMNPATALGFLFAGAALVMGDSRDGRSVAIALGGLAALVGAVKILALLGGPETGLDRWIFSARLEEDPAGFSNRMAPNTALSFVLAGTALVLLRLDGWRRVAQLLGLAVGILATFALAGYAYGLAPLYGLPSHIPMAPNSAGGFLALATGVLLADPAHGFVRYFTVPGPGGILARRLLPAALLIPFGVGWIRLLGERAGWYGPEFGVALMFVFNAVLLLALVGWTARLIDRSERERVQLDEALASRLDELRVVNRELESFTYAVSHDLRAPLRSISGFATALEEDCADALDEVGTGYLARIRAAARRMGELIDGLLDLSRITRASLSPEAVDLSGLAEDVVADLREAEPDRSVDVTIDAGLQARGDVRLLDVVVRNLLSNAWKYTREESAPRIEVGVLDAAGDDTPTWYVRDNGIGFDMEYSDKLFGAFQRLHGVGEFEGTGIGLATVQRIVHRHGGRIWAEAEVGRGATFYFTLHEGRDDE